MYNDIAEELRQDVRTRLSDYRYGHSLGVAESAAQLAKRYGADEDQAYLAGFVHDVMKEFDKTRAVDYLLARGERLTELEKNAPKLWHAMTGAVYLREKYGLDEELLAAVRYHTTGRTGMSLLEKIIFVADFISADRNYPGVEEMRRRAPISLEYAMTEGLRFTIWELSGKCAPIHPDTLACYNETLLTLQRKKEE